MERRAIQEQGAEAPVGPGTPTEPGTGIPWRAIVVGVLLLPPMTLLGHLAYFVAQSSVWTCQTLLRGPIILLFLLSCWTLAWRRFSPKLAGRWCLSRSEMALVYILVTVGTALAGECWAIYLVPALAGTVAYQAGSSHPEWAAWLADTPAWFSVRDPEVIRAIHHGHSSLYRFAHLRVLAAPVAAWSVLILSLALFTQCLAQLLRRQWIHQERLSFPLVYLPMALLETDGPRAWYRSRVFWAGLAVAGIIEGINGLNYLFPSIPYIPVKVMMLPPAAARPWSGLGPLWVAFYPWVIAVGFLVPLEVSFSLWFFFWVSRVQDLAATMMGVRNSGGFAPSLPPYHLHQDTGAFLVMGAMLLWRTRHDVATLWRRRDPSTRRTLCGIAASVGVALAWAAAAHIPLVLAGAFLAVYGVFAIVLGRLIAESGCASALSPLSIHETVALAGNIGQYPRASVVAFGWWHNLGERLSDNLLPHQATGMRLAEDVRADRRVNTVMAVGAAVGVLAGIWSLLHLFFHYGIMSAQVRGWPARDAPQYAPRLIHGWLNGGLDALQRDKLVAVAAGGGITALLAWLRQTYAGWPLHPIGFAVAGAWGMQEIWCPLFVAWLAKWAVMRMGGIGLYRVVLPFFLGALLGDFLIPMGWAVIGLLTGQQMYLSYPH